MKYIDADKLIAEIEKRIKELEHDKYISAGSKTARIAELRCIDRLIDSLQQEQPEVDLEKELEKYCRIYYNCNYPDQIQNGKCSVVMPHIVEAARHFYELGLKARKNITK